MPGFFFSDKVHGKDNGEGDDDTGNEGGEGGE